MPERFTKHECLHAIQTLKVHGAAQLFELEKKFNGNFYGAWKSIARKFPGAQNPHELLAKLGGIKIVTVRDIQYPRLLSESKDNPYMLYVRGALAGTETCIAFIGSRKMNTYGSQVVEKVIAGLAGLNVCIVSGLAYGIDACAHRAALAHNIKTIAVLGSGIDQDSIYPREHKELADQIVAAGGAVISEYPPDSPVFKYNFPVRNRVIASMSHAVAVIQATTKSGSLITAREALDCGRDVFAVPGSIFQETSDGTNDLIAKGAHVLRSAADLTSHYPELSTPQNSTAKFAAPVGEVQQKILAATSVEGSRAEDLAASLKLPIQVVAAALTMLEMAGCIATNSSGIYAPVLSPHLTRQNQSN